MLDPREEQLSKRLLLRVKAGAPRTEHNQLVRALAADAVVKYYKECNSGV